MPQVVPERLMLKSRSPSRSQPSTSLRKCSGSQKDGLSAYSCSSRSW